VDPDPWPPRTPLLESAERAQHTVVGVVGEPVQLDLHGWVAPLTVERVLSGEPVPDGPIRIAWEELTATRGARLAPGDHVVVALDPLPTHSLWRKRIPDRDALVIAAEGSALLRSPDPGSLDLLAAYLELPPERRDGAEGTGRLLRLLVKADPLLGGAALAKLASRPKNALEANVDLDKELARVARDDQRPLGLRRGVIALIEARRLDSLRTLLLDLAAEGSALELPASSALSTLDGGLSADRVERLLERQDPALRALAVRHAAGTVHEGRLATLLRSDPSAEIRAGAAEALAGAQGRTALDQLTPALFDGDPRVRVRAARAVGSLGGSVVPRLTRLIDERPASDAWGPIVALAHAGEDGRRVLIQISLTHPERRVQRLARLALGRDVGEH